MCAKNLPGSHRGTEILFTIDGNNGRLTEDVLATNGKPKHPYMEWTHILELK